MDTTDRPPAPPGNRVIRITGRRVAPFAAAADPLAGVPGIDAAAARAGLMGNEKLYRRLLGMFVDQHADVQARLTAALDGGDAPGLTREAHDLGGLAASLGMIELAPNCRQLEHACRGGTPLSQLAPLVEPLRAELQRLVVLLAPLRGQLG